VSGEIAGSLGPFNSRFTIGFAIGTSFISHHSVTPLTRLYDGIASPTVVRTAILLHENTFCSYFNGLTDHDTLPPFSMDLSFSMI
jgi:hypothetical protein